ncbi:MAG: Crp/Fnr family transcriptional regulator [Deltaproteobacteria bacterium]|nr:Crp/Fnr family transcriptional regulator [Deltaproteobacteria bacterium]
MLNVTGKMLQQTAGLAAFSLPKLDALAARLTVRNYERHEIIFEQDRKAESVYVLISGVVQIAYLHNDCETVVALVPGGELFGLDAIANAAHPFRATAFEHCVAAAIKAKTLVECLLGTPYESYLNWHRSTVLPWRHMQVHCIKGISLDLRKRLAMELGHLADRFGKPHEQGVRIDLRISHEVLAAIVGASRQQVTEYLNQFDRDKIIAREGRRIIVNRDKLKQV